MGYAIYCRISRDIEGRGAGVERQENECRELAEREGITVDHVYRDNDISAFSGKARPAYMDMLTAVEKGHHEGIICWHVDRLYRRTRDLEAIVDLVEKTGAKVRTVNAGDLDLNTATGRVTARMVAAIANYEVDHMIERSKSSQRARAAQGKYRGGYIAFGYRKGPQKSTIEIDPEQAAIVREAAAAILDGTSVLAIARRFNERGLVTQNGKKFRASTIRRMLTKPTVAGLSHHNGKVLGRGEWEPILDESDWHAVCAILDDPARRTHKGNVKRWQGAGLYVCGRCDTLMRTAKVRRKTSKSKRAYQCPECALTRDLDWVDEYIDALVLKYLDKPENRLEILRTIKNDGADTGMLIKKRDALTQRKSSLGVMFARGEIDAAQLAAGTTEIAAIIDEISNQLAAARQDSPLVELVLSEDELEKRWQQFDAERRSEIIDILMKVTILPTKPRAGKFDPTRIKIDWK